MPDVRMRVRRRADGEREACARSRLVTVETSFALCTTGSLGHQLIRAMFASQRGSLPASPPVGSSVMRTTRQKVDGVMRRPIGTGAIALAMTLIACGDGRVAKHDAATATSS